GFYASSTSIFSTTTVNGALNIGTLTATSGTSYINALTLGTKLANTELANSSVTITPVGSLTASGCSPVALGGTCILTGLFDFTPTSVFGSIVSATNTSIAALG